ncbi:MULTISPECIES: PAS domain-containing sensor histidine kinase [unclassified Sphingobacterium]|uniref:PAS domain-containing sensor histidine kinase n=1 Tax=unclassified Sphingobacterium TaxID=2609468 RepID=UPI0025F21418|nr:MULTISPECIES: PAS domain S-box protein [unclassified Sphingobacterium]
MENELDALKLKIAELSDFIENGSVPLHRVDGNGIIIWANQAELDLLGYRKEEYIGFPIRDFHADLSVIQEILTRLLNNETLRDFPARLKCKDGSIKHVYISSNALMVDGKFIYSRCFTKDVTKLIEEEERRVAEEGRKNKIVLLLKKSEERLRMAIAATDLGTWDWVLETGKIYFSPEAKQMLGLTFDENSIYAILNHIYPEDRVIVDQVLHNLQNATADENFSFTCRVLKAGQTVPSWIEVRGTAHFEGSTTLNRIIGSILDVTERKEAEENNAQLVAIVNSSYDAIVGKTLEGIVTSWNDAAEQVFGFSAQEMIGQSILKVIPEDRWHEEDFILEQLRSGESIRHLETKRKTKGGKLIDVSLTISPIKNTAGQITGISKIARDITYKVQEEQKKNDFISMVSHELKTPLTSILLCAQVMQRMSRKSENDLAAKMAQKIEGHTGRMSAMIRDFLSLARIEESKIQLRKEMVPLDGLLQEIKEEASFMTEQHHIQLVCDNSHMVYADRDKIGQVLNNLVSNAIKYSPEGGKVTIGCEDFDDHLKIYVSDEGVGISKSDQKKLFERFYRVENDTLASISGFGIGLYIVAEILNYHDSKIEVESELGKGSTFSFLLPKNEQ